jgi:HAE1 family hydrophobic/amphiphilic exporter-1
VADVRRALVLSNRNFPVGSFEENAYEYLVRVDGAVKDYRLLGDIAVKEVNGALVRVKDVAKVVYGSEEKENGVFIDGGSVLMLSVYKQPASNILSVSRRVDRSIGRLNGRYGGTVRFQKVFDESESVKSSLRDLLAALLLGIVFTVLSVFIFLFDVRVSLIIILTVPLSIIGTFIVMRFLRVSINLLTLGGFSLAIGMIVDNAVIVVTSVFERLCEEKRDARYYESLRRIMPAVTSATFTTVVVFFPVLFLSGVLKLIFVQLSLVVVTALLFSLVLAVTLIPVMLERVKVRARALGMRQAVGGALARAYRRALSTLFERPAAAFAALGVVTLLGALSYGGIEKRFLESFPQSRFAVTMFVKRQVSFEYTARLSDMVSGVIKGDGRVDRIIAFIGIDGSDVTQNLDGMYGENTAVFEVYTKVKGESIYPLIESVRRRLRVFSDVDFIVRVPDNPVQRLVSRSEFDAVVKLYDPSAASLVERVRDLDAFLRERGLAEEVLTSYYAANTEESLHVKRDEASLYKLDAPLIGEYLASAVSGLKVGDWKNGDFDVPIMLRFPRGSFSGVEDLMNLSMTNRDGADIRLGDVLTVRRGDSPNFLLRENQRGYAKVEYNRSRGGDRRPFFEKSREKRIVARHLEETGADYAYADQFTALRESYGELLLAFFLAVFLEYIILAWQFNSFSEPFLSIAMIPLSLPGVLLIIAATNASLNINTFMSIIVLVGLLVNNAIMLFMEYKDRKVVDREGVISASTARLVPVLITTLSTILALVPSLFTNNRIQETLSATIILGLLYATAVTLLYLPVLYHLVRLKRGRGP